MPVSFVQPVYLWLLLLLLPLWLLSLISPLRLTALRRWLSLGLRTVILCTLVFALAGAQLVWPAEHMTTVFVVDNSDSVSPVTRAKADQYIQAALSRMPEGDRGGIVVFGGDAVVERPPSENREFARTTVVPPSDQTDISRALQLALAILPSETRKRIVLLSDGAETRGRALDTATLARTAEVPIETVSLVGPPVAEDVALEALEAPATAREGQQVRLTLQAQSGLATSAELTVLLDRQPVLQTTVQLEAGLNRIPITVPAPGPGFHSWEARLLAPDDTVGANNVQFGFSEVRGQPRVLLVEGAPGRGANLSAALEAAQLNPTTIAPKDLPSSLIGMDAYDVIVLVDTPFRSLPKRAAALLPAYVRELGRGLLMVGGADSYAAGGYLDTPVETALPVTMRTRGVKVQPDVALVLVIDRSGSMSGQKLELAKEGAAQSYSTLTEQDQIGVIAFDSSATWAVNLQKKPPTDEFLNSLGSIGEGGGTDLRPGLEQATSALENAEAKIKHIVLLTDGQAEYNYDDVIQRMKGSGITLTSVGIDDFDPNLQKIAPETGGLFYEVDDLNDIPRLFFDESLRVTRRGIVEKEFTPVLTFPAPAVRDLRAVPPLYGYNAVTPKDTAQVILESDDGDPILAQWQYGLGRAAAWTPDMKGQWAKDWVTWDQFGRFSAQLVGSLLPTPSLEGFEASTAIEGTALALDLRAEALDGRARTGLGAVGRIVGADGSVQELPLIEVEPGRYRGTTALPEAGVYRAQVLVKGGDGQALGVVSTGAVVPPSAEYLQREGNLGLLQALAQQTGGRSDLPVERVWETPVMTSRQSRSIIWPLLCLAVLLWPLDIAVRRLLLPRPKVIESWLKQVRASGVRTQTVDTLARQRARVQALRRSAAPKPVPEPQRGPRSTEAPGTSSRGEASSSTSAPPAAPQFDWRKTRRGMIERPGERRGSGD
ncbi:MAG TPA: VWA domain-containing protein [Herpetosiphonaceae bacterium]